MLAFGEHAPPPGPMVVQVPVAGEPLVPMAVLRLSM